MTPENTAGRPRRFKQISDDERRQLFERTGIDETVETIEAAELLGYRAQTLRRWACDGSGPIRPRRINGRLRWSVTEIRTLVAGDCASAAA